MGLYIAWPAVDNMLNLKRYETLTPNFEDKTLIIDPTTVRGNAAVLFDKAFLIRQSAIAQSGRNIDSFVTEGPAP